VWISGIGKVRLVISFDDPDLKGTYAVLITNQTNWSAKEVLEKYLHQLILVRPARAATTDKS
jgi:hypothetical protein